MPQASWDRLRVCNTVFNEPRQTGYFAYVESLMPTRQSCVDHLCVCVRVHLHVCTHWYEGQELRWVSNLSPPLWLGYLANQELPGICLSGAISLPSAGLQACTAVPGFHEGPEIRTQFLILAQQTPLTGPSPCPSTFSNFFPPETGFGACPGTCSDYFIFCKVCMCACMSTETRRGLQRPWLGVPGGYELLCGAGN